MRRQNYSYKKRLLLFAQAVNIRVQYRPVDGDGAYIPVKRKVIIDDDLTPEEEIATLLHELGHVLEDAMAPDNNKRDRLERAYVRVYDAKETPNQLRMVLRCERKAWAMGRAIAILLGIKLGPWYDKSIKDSIAAYKK